MCNYASCVPHARPTLLRRSSAAIGDRVGRYVTREIRPRPEFNPFLFFYAITRHCVRDNMNFSNESQSPTANAREPGLPETGMYGHVRETYTSGVIRGSFHFGYLPVFLEKSRSCLSVCLEFDQRARITNWLWVREVEIGCSMRADSARR